MSALGLKFKADPLLVCALCKMHISFDIITFCNSSCELQKGNVFTSVFQSVHGAGVGVCMVGGMCGRGTFVAGGMHCRGHTWQRGICGRGCA